MSDAITDRLVAYERHLTRIGAPVVKRLLPGLSDDAMDALTEPVGLRLPAEARAWWGWHDGTVPDKNGGAPVAPYRPFGSLADMVDGYRDLRALYAEAHGQFLDAYWPATWLPFTGLLNGDLYASIAPIQRGQPRHFAASRKTNLRVTQFCRHWRR